MHYVFEAGAPRRVMHIERATITGEHTLTALCGRDLPFNRTINAPWALGRKVCRDCVRITDRYARTTPERDQ